MHSNRNHKRPFNKNRTKEKFHNNSSRKINYAVHEQLCEEDVGITEYISDTPGFSGIIKGRYSDFHVNEINNAGEIAKLTDTSIPEEFTNDNTHDGDTSDYSSEYMPEETWSDIRKMLESTEETPTTVTIDVTNASKEDRTKIHAAVKATFGKAIVSTSKQIDGKGMIEFSKFKKGENRKNHTQWPSGVGEYVHFLVYKETTDTLDACFKISDCLRVKSSMLSYAGVKDRRAKTTQWFCVKKVTPQSILNKTKRLYNIHVGNFTFKDQPLKIGQLKGNKFRIALRNVTADDSIINKAMESLKTVGFINYYGLQRFGNDKEVPTFTIGIKLLQGNWKEACNLILKPRTSEDPNLDITQAKCAYRDTSDSQFASKQFKRNHNKCVESKLLLGLAKNHNNDYVNALENIPRNMRLLYLHSVQSLIWNKMVSRRIKEFGLKPIVGDLVLLNEDRLDKSVEDISSEETKEEAQENTHEDAKVLTESDLNEYTIYDIVLPLPGYDVKYPENEVKNWYTEILTEYGLSLEMPKQRVKTYCLSGAYRKVIGRVDNCSWKTIKYDHPNDTLIRSDYEELKGEEEPKDNDNGQYKALIVEFCLKSSSYATMVLHEILKMNTSTSTHAQLSKTHEGTQDVDTPKQSVIDDVEFAKTSSLLNDTAKYEEFKKMIFEETPDTATLKRKIDDTSKEAEIVKKSKIEEENSEACIKMQSSLI